MAHAMNKLLQLLCLLATSALGEVRVPAFTAYLAPDPNGANVSKDGIAGWKDPKITVSWFGEIKEPGSLDASVLVRLPQGAESRLRLTVAGQSHEARASGNGQFAAVKFGTFAVAR